MKPTKPRRRKRPYRMDERAKARDETRLRIVEAAVQLHEKLGPAATTVSAIAERAGVQRLTVYRHFPDDAAIFAACTAHWGGLHPPPDPALWSALADPLARATAAVAAYCAYYADTRGMWRVAYRDAPLVKPIQPVLAGFDAHLAGLAETLAGGFGAKGRVAQALRATIGHALAFSTWSDLEQRGLADREKATLARAWLEGVCAP
ncbi:MAG TPA: helix-turn-helix domain-containing protein [Dongiaceae bacterium]|jgi:AcrR family transcriptional regulator|nr:helix-turn-helix domain-containing protein [Dongiaceae bacterium]